MVEMDKIVSLSKRRRYIFQPERDFWQHGFVLGDYGVLGVDLKNNVCCNATDSRPNVP
jgi:glycyl-tRNA synthetase (class II)